MANYVITKANVIPTTVGNVKPQISRVTAGGAITAGTGVAIDATDGFISAVGASDIDRDAFVGIDLNDRPAGERADV